MAEPLGALGALDSILLHGDRPYRLLRTRSGSLWLIPQSSRLVRGVHRVFPPTNPLMRCAWAAWRFGLPVGSRVALNSRALEEVLTGVAPGCPPDGVVVYIGTPGAYRKAVLGLWKDVSAWVMVKLALVPLADPWVAWEARVLERLVLSSLTVPRLLYSGQYGGRYFHATAPLTAPVGPPYLTRAHFEFAAQLYQLEPSRYIWSQCPLVEEWLSDLGYEALSRRLPTLERVLTWLGERLSHRELSFGWAHRDFVPWNTRWAGARLFVLDWEMARPHRPPGYDLLHFTVMQAVLRGGSPRIPWRALGAWLALHAPEWAQLERELYATYLLDQAFYYSKARLEKPDMGDDRVLNWLLSELRLVVRS